MAEELKGNTKKVYESMQQLGMKSEEKAKGLEDIVREARLPKGAVANSITELTQKKLAKRRAGDKTAKYFLLR
ncbi:MAG TPA: hypothetical protein ENN68_08650 [Methanomicrobia archaeon]|nr:hypothetical protein [Methanomicrobia archaeon]